MLRFLHMADLHLGADFNMLPVDKAEKAQAHQFGALKILSGWPRGNRWIAS